MTPTHRPFPSPDTRPARWALPLLVTALLIAVVWGAHLRLLPVGGLHFYDEFHTLDRASAFALHSDWLTVYSMHEPSFRKPPLQYWMTALLLDSGAAPLTALRLPSMLLALGALGAVGFLAYAVWPASPWCVPAAVLLFAGSAQFWSHALSGMLETGAGLFACLAVAAAILALRHPAWWYLCAAAIALGALQKAPIGLALVALYLSGLAATRKWHGIRFRDIRATRPFRHALWIALIGTLAWPLSQSLFVQLDAVEEFFGRQMIQRFSPTDDPGEIRTGRELGALIIAGEGALRWVGIAALAALPFGLRRPELAALPLMFAVFVAAMWLAGGHVTPRYTLIFLPFFAVATAAMALRLLPSVPLALAAVAGLSLASAGPIKPAAALALDMPEGYAAQIVALSALGAELQAEETLVICIPSGPRRIVPALASVYAANGRPFVRLSGSQRGLDRTLAEGALDGPLRGLCTPEDLARFAPLFAGLERGATLEGYVTWTAEGAR